MKKKQKNKTANHESAQERKKYAYDKPNGRDIRDKRKVLGWSPEELAKRANVGVSTIKRAEASQLIQLRNLSKIAGALNSKLASIAPRLQDSGFSVQILFAWGREFDLMAHAKKSIVIVDSYFSEYGRLGAALRERLRNCQDPLDVHIYMASPDYDFGAQRFREMTALPILQSAENPGPPLSAQLTDEQRNDYEKHFHNLKDAVLAAATPFVESNGGSGSSGSVTIHEYRCMPGLRIVAIDDRHFVFGPFPLFRVNPAHTCFYVRDENLDGADKALLEDIRMQIKHVKEASEPALASECRLRKNRRGDS